MDTLLRMFRKQVPNAQLNSFSTNGIGFFVDLIFAGPVGHYTNATTIIPGMAQFTFSTPVLRHISATVIPLYRKLAASRLFARHVAEAINRNNEEKLKRLLRHYVKSRFLVGINIQDSGFYLSFKFPGSRLIYRNQFFLDKVP
ncbi:hypothetical protein M3223_16520 [Paenibacillus pasadenensis]|uniref:hypothetical protein n=1 Tax=Paenibacillus pasadenensis TaxID=217090 RepID=UPI00203B8DC2|nr:hypothetical protein [Paenibacillus pasadenensis]MCM3748961.1 hypothetical protein [Paenibacillus pasadenensis]